MQSKRVLLSQQNVSADSAVIVFADSANIKAYTKNALCECTTNATISGNLITSCNTVLIKRRGTHLDNNVLAGVFFVKSSAE